MSAMISPDGTFRYLPLQEEELSKIQKMGSPVRCRCGGVYDLQAVTVTARYADCSVWKTPCCKHVTDDRPAGWSSGPSFERLDRRTGEPR